MWKTAAGGGTHKMHTPQALLLPRFTASVMSHTHPLLVLGLSCFRHPLSITPQEATSYKSSDAASASKQSSGLFQSAILIVVFMR